MQDPIIPVLAYYDVLDMPLKAEEIEQLAPRQFLKELPWGLTDLVARSVVHEKEGYYYLFDREYLVPLRKRREEFSRAKWRKAMYYLRWYRIVPFVRAVFVSGSLSINNCDELSDFDLIIVAKRGRIWLVRVLTLALFQALGVLRKHIHHTGHAPDKICPNHYITDKSLAIPFQNIYTAQLYANLVPVIMYDHELLENFKKANAWAEQYFAWNINLKKMLHDSCSMLCVIAEWLLAGRLGDLLESVATSYQRCRIERNNIAPVPSGHLVCNDKMLAFHSGSTAGRILEKYRQNLNKITIAKD